MTINKLILALSSMAVSTSAAALQPAASPAPQAESGQAAEPAAPAPSLGRVVPATAADVTAGAAVLDPAGDAVGSVVSVSDNGAVVSTGSVRVTIPLPSFGKSDRGLVIGATRAEVEAQAAAARANPEAGSSGGTD
jgi:hypothetical protein